MCYMNADSRGSVSYSHFCNSMLLLPLCGLKYNHQLCHFHYQCQNITNWALGTVQRFYPAILGQFSSNGLRTGAFEASKLVLVIVAPALSEIQSPQMELIDICCHSGKTVYLQVYIS
ncbi:uncharacterized protein [Typha angustifolia]|uniref:uncharacterized protein isoform X4 n=1 Tax=Typha angustifolia TaxID=59011 RepID=UPI003C2EA798